MVRKGGIFLLFFSAIVSCHRAVPSVHLEEGKVRVEPLKNTAYIYLLEVYSVEPLRIKPTVLKADSTLYVELSDSTKALLYAWEENDSSLHFLPDNKLVVSSAPPGLDALAHLLAGDTSGFIRKYTPPYLMNLYLKIESVDDSLLSRMLHDSLVSGNPHTLLSICIAAIRRLKDTSLAQKALKKLEDHTPSKYYCKLMLLTNEGKWEEASRLATESRLFDQPYIHSYMDPDSIPPEWTFPDDVLRKLYYADSLSPQMVRDLERIMMNPTDRRRNLIFFQTGKFLSQKSIKRALRKAEDIGNYYLARLYMRAGDTARALEIIRGRLKSTPIQERAPWWYELLLEASPDSSERLTAMAYLAYYYGWPEYRESVELLAPGKADSLRTAISQLLPEAPPLSGKTIDGKQIRAEELRGKILVLNFWATWCGPCKREIPHLNELVEQFGRDTGIVFIAITKEDRKTVEKFLKEHPFEYTIIVDGDKPTRDYHVMAFPTHYVINREGRIVFNQIGYTPQLKERLEEVLSTLKGGR